MAEVSEALRKKMLSLFKTKRETDSQISAFRRKLDAKKATQADVSDYSARLGELARDTIREVLTPDELPNETLYFNILMDTVDPLMRSAHALVNRTAAEAQKIIDEANGLGLNEVEAPYPRRRVRDLLFKAGDPELDLASQMRLLSEPIVTLTLAFYDDHVRVNAEERFRAGMAPKIVRRASFKCCDWCASLDGTYDYGDVSNTGNDVFRRHERCRCTVEYVCDGQRQDVWSKKIYAADEDTLSSRDTYHTSTGDTSPETLQMRSKYGLETEAATALLKDHDITFEYRKKARPGHGRIVIPDNYDLSKYRAEYETANKILEIFGGEIELLQESRVPGEKRSDYLWNGKMWELKKPTTADAIDSAVRKGLKQIGNNPGGIILNFENGVVSVDDILQHVDYRMRRSKGSSTGKSAVDVIIIVQGTVKNVLRYT